MPKKNQKSFSSWNSRKPRLENFQATQTVSPIAKCQTPKRVSYWALSKDIHWNTHNATNGFGIGIMTRIILNYIEIGSQPVFLSPEFESLFGNMFPIQEFKGIKMLKYTPDSSILLFYKIQIQKKIQKNSPVSWWQEFFFPPITFDCEFNIIRLLIFFTI